MRSDRNGQRLACPRCRANNFVGQAQCWQCRASLPPPEVLEGATLTTQAQSMPVPMQSVAPIPAVRTSAWTPGVTPPAPSPSGRRSVLPLVIGVVLLTVSIIVFFNLRHAAAPSLTPAGFPASSGMSQSENELYRDARGVVPERDLPNSGLPDPGGPRLSMPARDPLPASADPTEAAARQAIQRAIPRLGLPPGSNSDGNVHLRNGSTISREQYEETQRKLQNNPLLGGPPSVPRL